jgi:carboxyl-terminal processing protease
LPVVHIFENIPTEERVKKVLIYGLGILLALIVLGGAFSGGFLVGHSLPQAAALSLPSSAAQSITPASQQALFKPFWAVWDIVHNQYVDQPVDNTALMRGAISGMLAALGDQHTSYMDPATWKAANSELAGSFEGIGAYVDTTGDYLTITSPMDGSPAQKAGLKAGDQIIAVDGKDVTGVAPETVRSKVIGPAGTQVKLTIKREGVAQSFDVTVTREKITVPSVEHKMLANNIAYVKINDFGATTGAELKTALQDLMPQKPKGLILDLRNDGGGYLTAAVDVGSQFIKQGDVILYEKFGDGSRNTHVSQGGGLALDIPMVVLINKGTASASELISGALQDYGRAKLVGEQSYGKGTVQNWIPLSGEQGGVRVTIARWLTPKDRSIDKVGLTPDFVVPLTDKDSQAGLDPQLDKAIAVLTGSQ